MSNVWVDAATELSPREARDSFLMRGGEYIEDLPSTSSTDEAKSSVKGPLHVDARCSCPSHLIDNVVVKNGKMMPQGLWAEVAEKKEKVDTIFQVVDEYSAILHKVRKFADVHDEEPLLDGLLSRFEALMIYLLQVYRANTLDQVFLAALQYAKTFIRGSLLIKMKRLIEKILYDDWTGEMKVPWKDKKKGKTKGLDQQSSSVKGIWDMIVKGKLGQRLTNLTSLFVAMGLMPEKAETLLGKEFYQLFNIRSKMQKSTSVFDHIIEVLDYCVDCVYPALHTGNYWYLIEDRDYQDLHKEYIKCINMVDLYSTGQMIRLKDKYDVQTVSEVIVSLQYLQMNMMELQKKVDTPMKNEFSIRLIRIDKLLNDLYSGFHDSAIRTKPFSVLVRGRSSEAKTTLTSVLRHVISSINGFPEGEEYSCTLNANDKYQSELKPQHISVTFDDIGNTRPERTEGNPMFLLIQFINNCHCSALSAIAEMKGKNDIRVKMCFGTTNTEDCHASYFSVSPASVMRRFDLVLDVNVDPKCRDPSGKIESRFENRSMPDMWEITAWTIGLRKGGGERSDDWYQIPVYLNKNLLPGTTNSNKARLPELVDYLSEVTPHYYRTQQRLVEAGTAMNKQEHCKEHPLFTLPCAKCIRLGNARDIDYEGQIEFPSNSNLFTEVEERMNENSPSFIKDPLSKQAGDADEEEEFHSTSSMISEAENFLSRFAVLKDTLDIEESEQGASVQESVESEIPDIDTQIAPYTPPDLALDSQTPYEEDNLRDKLARKTKKFFGKMKLKKKSKITTPKEDLVRDEPATNFSRFASRLPGTEWRRPLLTKVVGENGMEWRALQEEDEEESEDLPPLARIRQITRIKSECLSKFTTKFRTMDKKYKFALMTVGALTTIVAAMKLSKRLHGQGALVSELEARAMTPTMVVEHDDKYKKNWVIHMKPSSASISINRKDFEMKIDGHLRGAFYQEIDKEDNPIGKRQYSNALPMGGGYWAMAGHSFEKGKRYDVWLLLKPREIVGVTHIHVVVDDSNFVHMPGKDIVKVRLMKGGNWTSSKYLSPSPQEPRVGDPIAIYLRTQRSVEDLDYIKEQPSHHVYRTQVDSISYQNIIGLGTFRVLNYTIPEGTFKGMCGAPVILDGRHPVILGIHTAGSGTHGACTMFNREEWDNLQLEIPGEPIYVSDDAPFPINVQGVPVPIYNHVHGRNAANWMESEKVHSFTNFGSTDLPNTRFKTDVVKSFIADDLKANMGIELKHSGPDRKAVRKARHKDLDAITRDRPPIDPTLLKWATEDLVMKMERFFESNSTAAINYKDTVHPIKLDDALSGVPGVPGIDPINVNTSLGFPINRKKYTKMLNSMEKYGLDTKKIITEVERPDGTIELHYSVKFDPEQYNIEELMEEVLEHIEDKQRVNIVYRANLKDEALEIGKVAKGKIRVFAGAPTHFVTLWRMLGLTSLTAAREIPTVFEDAVGVDAQGPDWSFLGEYITKFGRDRMVIGDFKEFDKCQDSTLNFASMEVEKYILKQCGYSEKDLKIFDGLATEVCLPVYEMEGGLIGTERSNPSGQPWTVRLNGTTNRLLMRIVYYANHQEANPGVDLNPRLGKIPLFHEVIKALVFGDDNVMGVSPDEPYFTHRSAARQLRRWGIEYTDALKTGEEYDFVSADEMSFLKRKWKYHDGLNAVVAPLEIDSINKSLTCTKKTKADNNTEAMVMANCMSAALFEAYLHGEEMYWEYFRGFESILHCVGPEGDTIGDHYVPLTVEDCQLRYHMSKSRYKSNLERYQVPLEMQSGDADPLESWHSRELHAAIGEEIQAIERETAFQLSRAEIRVLIRRRRCERERHRRHTRRQVRFIRRMWVHVVRNSWEMFEGHYGRFGDRFYQRINVRAINVMWRLYTRRILLETSGFSEDVVEYISHFAPEPYVIYYCRPERGAYAFCLMPRRFLGGNIPRELDV